MNRTPAYQFTVEMKDGIPVGSKKEFLQSLREIIKETNKHRERKQYVKLQGRLGKDNPNAWKYHRIVGRYFNHQAIRLGDAAFADVYVYQR